MEVSILSEEMADRYPYSYTDIDGRREERRGKVGLIRAEAGGLKFSTCYLAEGADPATIQCRRETAIQDLEKFVKMLWFYGCGGEGHDFGPDADNRVVAVKCAKCDAIKPRNCVWSACIGSMKETQ